jgi:hypothetical protein
MTTPSHNDTWNAAIEAGLLKLGARYERETYTPHAKIIEECENIILSLKRPPSTGPTDAERLDWLNKGNGIICSVTNDKKEFVVNVGLHSLRFSSAREAIDAAMHPRIERK